MITSDLNQKWFTEIPQNPLELEKIILILNSLNYETPPLGMLQHSVWFASSQDKLLVTYGGGLREKDFNDAKYNYIPLEYLLSL